MRLIKKAILTYYYIFYYQHFHAKNKIKVDDSWISAFGLVVITITLLMTNIFMLIFDAKVYHINRVSFMSFFMIFPALLLYHLLFSIFKVEKHGDVPEYYRLKINIKTKIYAWTFLISTFIGFTLISIFTHRLSI